MDEKDTKDRMIGAKISLLEGDVHGKKRVAVHFWRRDTASIFMYLAEPILWLCFLLSGGANLLTHARLGKLGGVWS